MKLTFRWYGLNDSIPLAYIREIPSLSGVVTSVYDVKPGEVWPKESLQVLKEACDNKGLKMEVIESIPVVEEIKYGDENRDQYIEVFKENLRRVAAVGGK